MKRLHVLFYKKLNIWASTESFLKLPDFEHPESYEFLKGSITIYISTAWSLKSLVLQKIRFFEANPMFRLYSSILREI